MRSTVTGWMTPRSQMIARISRAGVTSNAGLYTSMSLGAVWRPKPCVISAACRCSMGICSPLAIDKSNVLVEVEDSGTGIAAETLESIFDPFITSKPEGLGLGLSICRSIIERHGGKISAANNPERGATFSITLPATRE